MVRRRQLAQEAATLTDWERKVCRQMEFEPAYYIAFRAWIEGGRRGAPPPPVPAITDAERREEPLMRALRERFQLRRQVRERAATGGHHGAGKAKRPHTDLIRRAVAALAEKKVEVSAANVRLMLKSGWNKLAFEWGDPLRDIVDVRVLEKGPIEIEYTSAWATKHRADRFVRLDRAALKKQIDRAAGSRLFCRRGRAILGACPMRRDRRQSI